MSDYKRGRLYVDSRIQGALMVRAAVYWALCLLTMTLVLVGWRILVNPVRAAQTHFNDILFHYGPAIVVGVLLLPLAVFDVLRLSNRFVGPFFRLRGAMRQLARGERVDPIFFRRGDFWHEFAEEFNAVAARLEAAERALRDKGHKVSSPAGSTRGPAE